MSHRARLLAFLLTLGLFTSSSVARFEAQGPSVFGSLVISQVYGGGAGSTALYASDYVELFNRGAAPVPLSGLSIQYASVVGVFGQRLELSGTLEPGQYFLIGLSTGTVGAPLPAPDLSGTIAMAAGSGKVALVNSTSALQCGSAAAVCSPDQIALFVDLVGYGTANFFEGAGPTPLLSATTAAFRGANGCTDTNNNLGDFAVLAPAPRNTASPRQPCAGSTMPTVVGAASPSSPEAGQTVVITAGVSPGINPPSTSLSVVGDLSAIGGQAAQPLLDDGIAPDQTAGDSVYSTAVVVPANAAPGPYAFGLQVTDGEGRTGSFTGSLLVIPPPVINLPHDVQGAGGASPLTGATVTVEGVVTARKFNGFFVQTEVGREDAQAESSEGLFVFTGSGAPVPAAAEVGNVVRVTGLVAEFVPGADPLSPPLTELTSPSAVTIVGTAVLPAAIPLDSSIVSPAGAFDDLERFEGMRVATPSLTATSGTEGSKTESQATSVSTGAFYAVLTGTPRPFREPGIELPLPVPVCAAGVDCAIPIFDSNPERLRVDTDALEGLSPVDVTTGAVIAGVTGPLDYSFRTYTVLAEHPLSVAGGMVAVGAAAPSSGQFTVASFNMERFFDTVNDPGVSDVALTPAAFERRLAKASLAIRTALNSPDILAVQEVENLGALEAVATRVNADRGLACPGVAACYRPILEEGNDIGGIDVGFLVQEHVSVLDTAQWGRDLPFSYPCPTGTCVEDFLNDRPSLSIRARVTGPVTHLPADVIIVVNHLRSLNGVDDPASTVRVRAKRQAQAEFLAGVLDSLQETWPNTAIVSVGDYNAFAFNDGYVDVMGTVRGEPTAPTEVANASVALVMPPMVDVAAALPQAEQYSYVFGGNAQTLDHVLVSGNALSGAAGVASFAGVSHARINADFPEALRTDATRVERLSDHDPVVAYFGFPVDTEAPVLEGVPADIAVAAETVAGAPVTFGLPTAIDNLDGPVPVTCAPASGSTFPIGETVVTCSAADAAGNTGSRSFLVTVTAAVGGRMTGAGHLSANGVIALFTLAAESSALRERGSLNVVAVGRGVLGVFVSQAFTAMQFTPDGGLVASGVGTWNGQGGHTFELRARDAGDPGRGRDTFAVVIRGPRGEVVSIADTLDGGNLHASSEASGAPGLQSRRRRD